MYPNKKMLDFHEWITESICQATLNKRPLHNAYYQKYSNNQNLDWPCVPRSRPIAFADSTHDLPGFNRFSRKTQLAQQNLLQFILIIF